MRKNTKNFTCNLSLSFTDGSQISMISIGFGRNKKDAKKMAVEKIIIELI